MRYSSNAIPNAVLEKMNPEDRPKGKAGWTAAECQLVADAKSERELQRQISNYLTLRGIPFWNSRMDKKTRTAAGVADYAIIFAGRGIAVECKMPGQALTIEQGRFKSLVLTNGGIHLTCSNLGQLKAVLNDLTNAEEAGQA